MKLSTKVHEVERGGVQGESEFTIRNSSKAFDILSSGLYSDPITAIVREISCNAYDAHVAAGHPNRPFEVHLPNRLEPFFSVKDFGIGLSDEDVCGLYSTYFASTKSESNDFIGAFGLGSKSPFSYSKSFEVISIHGGFRRTYSVFVNEQGVPTIARLAEIATDEHNGVEVKLTVNTSDFSDFKEATQILRYFPVLPVIKGQAGFKFSDWREEGFITLPSGHLIKKGSGYSWNRKPTVVQGNVPYEAEIDRDKLSSTYSVLLSEYDVVIMANIGDLEVDASRENIRITKSSQEYLMNTLETIRMEFLKTVEDQAYKSVKDSKSDWDAFSLLRNTLDLNQIERKHLFKGYTAKHAIMDRFFKTDGKVKMPAMKYHKIVAFRRGRGTKAYRVRDNEMQYNWDEGIQASHNHKVVLCDVQRAALRVNQIFNNTIRTVFAIVPLTEKTINKVREEQKLKPLKTIPYQREYDTIIKQLGNPTVEKVSDITEDLRPTLTTAGGKRTRSTVTFRRFMHDARCRKYNVNPMVSDVNTTPTGGLYFVINSSVSRKVKHGGEELGWNHLDASRYFTEMLKLINDLDGSSHDIIYAVTPKTAKAIKDDPNWIYIFDKFEQEAKVVEKVNDVLSFHHRRKITSAVWGIEDQLNESHFVDLINTLDPSSHFRLTLEPAIELAAEYQNTMSAHSMSAKVVSKIQTLCSILGITLNLDTNDDTPLFEYNDFVNHYPMMEVMTNGYSYSHDRWETVIDYIKLMDSK